MNNYVNLKPLQDQLEDLLFSVRFIVSDHNETALNVEDYEQFEIKAKEVSQFITSLLNLNTSLPNQDQTKEADYVQNLYEINHIKEARLKIFTVVLNEILSHCKKEKKDFTSIELSACMEITNDAMKMLYKVNL